MLITILKKNLPIIKYVVVEPMVYVDITPMLPLKRAQVVAFRMYEGRVNDNFLCFDLAEIDPMDLKDIEDYGVSDLWLIADRLDEFVPDETERLRVEIAMARVHVC